MKKSEARKILYDELKNDEKILIQWSKENPLSTYMEIALITLAELQIITIEEYRNYKAKIEEKTGLLKSYWLSREEEIQRPFEKLPV